jgi:hypothetical protein
MILYFLSNDSVLEFETESDLGINPEKPSDITIPAAEKAVPLTNFLLLNPDMVYLN